MKASEALVEIEKGVRAFKAFQYMEKAATFIQNLEQIEKESQAAADKARAELAEVTKTLNDLRAQAETAKAESKLAAAAAKRRAEEIITKAEAKAFDVDAVAQVNRKESENVLANLMAQRDAVKAEVAEAEKVLATLLSEIDKAKKRVANLLGA